MDPDRGLCVGTCEGGRIRCEEMGFDSVSIDVSPEEGRLVEWLLGQLRDPRPEQVLDLDRLVTLEVNGERREETVERSLGVARESFLDGISDLGAVVTAELVVDLRMPGAFALPGPAELAAASGAVAAPPNDPMRAEQRGWVERGDPWFSHHEIAGALRGRTAELASAAVRPARRPVPRRLALPRGSLLRDRESRDS